MKIERLSTRKLTNKYCLVNYGADMVIKGGIVDRNLVKITDNHFIIDIMYARPNNIVGQAVYEKIGFGNHAYLHKDATEKLYSLIPELEKEGYKMRICDAYRPPLAHNRLLEIIPIDGFFAKNYEKSNHCHGTAIDVCLTDLNGNNLLYPTEIDAYEERFHKQVIKGEFGEFQEHLQKARHDYMGASDDAIKNREFLRELMEKHGFESIPHEWWHYNLVGWQNYPVIEW